VDFANMIRNLKGVRATVVGLGISNLPLIDYLLSHGAIVTARDGKERKDLGNVAKDLEARGVRVISGKDYLQNIEADLLFRTPGIRPDRPEFAEAVARGAYLTSEMELFLELTPAHVIGITGSDGKTTTTTLTGLFLEAQFKRSATRRVFVGGNIGAPLLPCLEDMTKDDVAVVELSSFQLQTMRRSCHAAAVTNLSPNHLNWHTDMEEYVDAKTNIFRHAQNGHVVINAENERSTSLLPRIRQRVTLFSSEKHSFSAFSPLLKKGDAAVWERDGKIFWSDGDTEVELIKVDCIRLPGKHNLENYMTALALTCSLVEREAVDSVAATFTGVRHRLEPVREFEGVRYYNSSIDSSPTRTTAALSALAPERPIVICGGADKNFSFEPLAVSLCRYAKAVVLTGQTAQKIQNALQAREEVTSGALPVLSVPDFRGAVEAARSIACRGDIVLLSPSCTSFDAFKNFEERGDFFCRIVRDFQ